MNTTEKQLITTKLKDLKKSLSQNKLARRADVSGATISQMLNENWDLIKDDMWRKVANNLNINLSNWINATTSNVNYFIGAMDLAKKHSMSIGISAEAGIGKTHSYRLYMNAKKNVFHVQCAFHWTQRTFLQNFSKQIGAQWEGLKTYEMAESIILYLKKLDNPLVILDEADKLKESPFLFFIDLYNQLDGQCGFLVSGAPYLKLMIEKRSKSNKRGYREFYSRIGNKFFTGTKHTKADTKQICIANGIDDLDTIKEIHYDADSDVRRIKRSVIKQYLIV